VAVRSDPEPALHPALHPGVYLTDGTQLFRILQMVPERDAAGTFVIAEDCYSEDSVGWNLHEMASMGLQVVERA
jgi:hypothetical protein